MRRLSCLCINIFIVITCVDSEYHEDINDGKSSLVFVFDTTGSMYDDLRQLKESAELILDTALEESDVISNFVFVPYHDPGIGPPTVTRHKAIFKAALNIVRVYGGGDCPEKALGGIQLALNVSRPRSFIYVFTDATANDHRLVGKVLDIVQRKQSEVVFVLTGHCNDLARPSYQVFEQIAAASSGQVFNLNKTNVHQVLEMVRTTLKGRSVNLGSVNHRAGYNHSHKIPVDESVAELRVSLSGLQPQIQVVDPSGQPVTGPPRLVTQLDLAEIMVVKVLHPEVGNWRVTAGSSRDYSLRVAAVSNLTFDYGFSLAPSQSLAQTSRRPMKDTYNSMIVALTPPDATVKVDFAEILSLSGQKLFELSLKCLNNSNAYLAEAFVPPEDFFYVAINGHDKNNQGFRRVGTTAVQAKIPDAPYLTAPRKMKAHKHESVTLQCVIESLVPVSAMWMFSRTKIQPMTLTEQSTTTLLYIIDDMSESHAGEYQCFAKNSAGVTTVKTLLEFEVNPPKVAISPGNLTMQLGSSLTVSCRVKSEVPPKMQLFHRSDRHVDDDVTDIYISPDEDGVYVFNKTIEQVEDNHGGKYTCVAENAAGRVTKSLHVKIEAKPLAQILGPHSIIKPIYADVQLLCHVENSEVVQWVAPNATVVMETHIKGSYDGMFEVRNISDNGSWSCVGTKGKYKATDSIDVDITIKPTVRIEGATNVTLLNGTAYEVVCLIEARPEPRVIWHKETEAFLNHTVTSIDKNKYKSVLTLNSSIESVEATYFCIGENSEGIAEASIVINVRRKMLVLEGLGDKSVELYSKLDQHCAVEVHPKAQVKWYHNGTEVSTNENIQLLKDNSTLRVLSVNFDNEGLYECHLDNGFEKMELNGSINIVGLEQPVLVKEPVIVKIRTETSTNITCRILRGKPLPLLTWQFKNQTSEYHNALPFGIRLNGDSSQLIIPIVQLHHKGDYRCVATNVAGVDNYDVKVIVQYPPQLVGPTNELSALISPLEVRAGDDVRFSCEATGMPLPLVIWTKDGKPLVYNNIVYLSAVNSLVIERASVYDTGLYTCRAINSLGSMERNFTLFVYEPPSIETVPTKSEVEVLEGSLVDLPCFARGVPTPLTKWLRETHTIEGGREIIDEFGIRFVANLTDFGNYTCLAENKYGSASLSYSVYVWVPPSVQASKTSVAALTGSNVTLQCDAVGFPVPVIRWTLMDDLIIHNTSSISFNDYGNLYLNNVTSEQGGVYACTGANIVGEDQKVIKLNIYESPKILEDFHGPYVATNVDSEFMIPCKATGKPKPYIAWFQDDNYLVNDHIFSVDYEGTLTIKSPSENMSGHYTCFATNLVGTASRTLPVQIYSVPSNLQSEESQAKVSVLEGSNTSLQCPIQSSPKDLVKWFKYAKFISQDTLQIINVSRQNTSDYACVVSNVAGAAYAKLRLEVEWAPKFEVQGIQNVEVIKGNDQYLNCDSDANPRPKIKWMFNSKPMIFEDRPRLRILNSQPRHTGSYQCVAFNSRGNATLQYDVAVLEPPFISEFDFLEVQLQEGSTAELQCKAKGVPPPYIKWKTNISYTTANQSISTNQWHNETLVNTNLFVTSGGLFRCEAINKAGFAQLLYKVSVIAPAKVLEIVLYVDGVATVINGKAEVVLGDRARIACKSFGQPIPEIKWIKNTITLNVNDDNISYADLLLDKVQTSHAGVYSCLVLNEGGLDEKKFRLEVLEPPRIFRNLFEDSSSGNTVELEVLSGQTFSLHCHPYGNPIPEVYWFKDGLPLRLFDDTMISTDYSEVLVSHQALYEHSGNYTCVARNSIGNTSLVYLLDVLVPPPLSKDKSKTVNVRFGKQLNLTCPMEGIPVPQVVWVRHPYVEITEDTPRITMINDGFTMIINQTEVSDSGKYTCVMTNKVGTTELTFDVTIEMAPSIAGNVGTDIIEDHVVALMRSIVLKCDVKAHPSPRIIWMKDTQELSEDTSKVQRVLDSGLLTIWHISSEAAGQYICVAENKAGTAHRRYNVAVKVPGKWSSWSSWGYCNVTCGLGYQIRTRSCRYMDDNNVTYDQSTDKVILDESECKGSETDKRKCHMPSCEELPINHRWSSWSEWSQCSSSCGVGSQTRTRRCRGRACDGNNVQIKKCANLPSCVDSIEKRELETFSSGEDMSTEMDSFTPEEIFETEPKNPDVNKISPNGSDAEVFNKLPSDPLASQFFSVNVTNNLDSSPMGRCLPGFTQTAENHCRDIDECTIEKNQCHSTQLCVNTAGGYRCGCPAGYRSLQPRPGQRCLDINECELELDGCEYACVNVAGGFVCACPRGMRRQGDKGCRHVSSSRQAYTNANTERKEYLTTTMDLTSSRYRRGRH